MVTNRNFATFEYGDSVYELAGGLLPELGERVGVTMDSPDTALPQLVGALGPNKLLRENGTAVQQVIPLAEAAKLAERSGIGEPLNRSLWTPDRAPHSGMLGVCMGAVANWQDRIPALAIPHTISYFHSVAGERIMDSTA